MTGRRLPPLIAICAVILLSSAVAGATGWATLTTSRTAEGELSRLIQNEHLRTCGTLLAYEYARLFPTRIDREFDLYRRGGNHYTTAGEILAWNNYPEEQAAKAAYTQFMASAGHRRAIQTCTYRRFAVGDFRSSSRRMFVVEFVQP